MSAVVVRKAKKKKKKKARSIAPPSVLTGGDGNFDGYGVVPVRKHKKKKDKKSKRKVVGIRPPAVQSSEPFPSSSPPPSGPQDARLTEAKSNSKLGSIFGSKSSRKPVMNGTSNVGGNVTEGSNNPPRSTGNATLTISPTMPALTVVRSPEPLRTAPTTSPATRNGDAGRTISSPSTPQRPQRSQPTHKNAPGDHRREGLVINPDKLPSPESVHTMQAFLRRLQNKKAGNMASSTSSAPGVRSDEQQQHVSSQLRLQPQQTQQAGPANDQEAAGKAPIVREDVGQHSVQQVHGVRGESRVASDVPVSTVFRDHRSDGNSSTHERTSLGASQQSGAMFGIGIGSSVGYAANSEVREEPSKELVHNGVRNVNEPSPKREQSDAPEIEATSETSATVEDPDGINVDKASADGLARGVSNPRELSEDGEATGVESSDLVGMDASLEFKVDDKDTVPESSEQSSTDNNDKIVDETSVNAPEKAPVDSEDAQQVSEDKTSGKAVRMDSSEESEGGDDSGDPSEVGAGSDNDAESTASLTAKEPGTHKTANSLVENVAVAQTIEDGVVASSNSKDSPQSSYSTTETSQGDTREDYRGKANSEQMDSEHSDSDGGVGSVDAISDESEDTSGDDTGKAEVHKGIHENNATLDERSGEDNKENVASTDQTGGGGFVDAEEHAGDSGPAAAAVDGGSDADGDESSSEDSDTSDDGNQDAPDVRAEDRVEAAVQSSADKDSLKDGSATLLSPEPAVGEPTDGSVGNSTKAIVPNGDSSARSSDESDDNSHSETDEGTSNEAVVDAREASGDENTSADGSSDENSHSDTSKDESAAVSSGVFGGIPIDADGASQGRVQLQSNDIYASRVLRANSDAPGADRSGQGEVVGGIVSDTEEPGRHDDVDNQCAAEESSGSSDSERDDAPSEDNDSLSEDNHGSEHSRHLEDSDELDQTDDTDDVKHTGIADESGDDKSHGSSDDADAPGQGSADNPAEDMQNVSLVDAMVLAALAHRMGSGDDADVDTEAQPGSQHGVSLMQEDIFGNQPGTAEVGSQSASQADGADELGVQAGQDDGDAVESTSEADANGSDAHSATESSSDSPDGDTSGDYSDIPGDDANDTAGGQAIDDKIAIAEDAARDGDETEDHTDDGHTSSDSTDDGDTSGSEVTDSGSPVSSNRTSVQNSAEPQDTTEQSASTHTKDSVAEHPADGKVTVNADSFGGSDSDASSAQTGAMNASVSEPKVSTESGDTLTVKAAPTSDVKDASNPVSSQEISTAKPTSKDVVNADVGSQDLRSSQQNSGSLPMSKDAVNRGDVSLMNHPQHNRQSSSRKQEREYPLYWNSVELIGRQVMVCSNYFHFDQNTSGRNLAKTDSRKQLLKHKASEEAERAVSMKMMWVVFPRSISWKSQNYKCAQCRTVVTPVQDSTRVQNSNHIANYCLYTGEIYCRKCFGGRQLPILARVVSVGDVSPYPICQLAYSYLSMHWRFPIISLQNICPSAYARHKGLVALLMLRMLLASLWRTIRVCPCRETLVSENVPKHFFNDVWNLDRPDTSHQAAVSSLGPVSFTAQLDMSFQEVRGSSESHSRTRGFDLEGGEDALSISLDGTVLDDDMISAAEVVEVFKDSAAHGDRSRLSLKSDGGKLVSKASQQVMQRRQHSVLQALKEQLGDGGYQRLVTDGEVLVVEKDFATRQEKRRSEDKSRSGHTRQHVLRRAKNSNEMTGPGSIPALVSGSPGQDDDLLSLTRSSSNKALNSGNEKKSNDLRPRSLSNQGDGSLRDPNTGSKGHSSRHPSTKTRCLKWKAVLRRWPDLLSTCAMYSELHMRLAQLAVVWIGHVGSGFCSQCQQSARIVCPFPACVVAFCKAKRPAPPLSTDWRESVEACRAALSEKDGGASDHTTTVVRRRPMNRRASNPFASPQMGSSLRTRANIFPFELSRWYRCPRCCQRMHRCCRAFYGACGHCLHSMMSR